MSQANTLKTQVEVTAQTVIDQLRKAVQPPGKKGLWLRQLSDKRLAEVYHRLKLGQSSYRIAQIAQKDWGVMTDSSVKSLARAVRLFRDKTVGLLKIESSTAPKKDEERVALAKSEKKRADRISQKIDAMGILAWAIVAQKERIEILVEREQKAMPFKFTDKSFEVLKDLLDSYIGHAMALGIMDAKPPELHLQIKHRFDGLLQHTIHGDGSNMIAAADRFLELAEKAALTMRLGDDGLYHTLPEEDLNVREEPERSEDSSGEPS